MSAATSGPRHAVRLLPGGEAFDVGPGEPLLAAALAAGIDWARSCRNGRCRACLCVLREGQAHHLVDWPGLSAEERAAGALLACVAAADSRLVIEPCPYGRGL